MNKNSTTIKHHLRFPKSERLRKKKEFELVLKKGITVASNNFTLKFLHGPRVLFGVLVSHTTDPKAVVRNRIKRRLREIYRTNKTHFSFKGSYLVIPKSQAKELDYHSMKEEFLSLVRALNKILTDENTN
ncbi:MAG: ribonuclease P protein component [candidate division WOR-3 bacterium]|nr:ribonuclease P protein component [candidate division WOR-3 bacterium]MCX7756982.1 ribonuclease P protein component [candidate division WOR-3 bacterium]MDW7987841.1 ribonuclease P protein component [candidate division WOR-3 bacterium]